MKTRTPDYIAEHYATKPAVVLILLFLLSGMFWQNEKPNYACRTVTFDNFSGHYTLVQYSLAL